MIHSFLTHLLHSRCRFRHEAKQIAIVNELPVHGKAFVEERCFTKGRRAQGLLGSGIGTKFSTFLLVLGYIDGAMDYCHKGAWVLLPHHTI